MKVTLATKTGPTPKVSRPSKARLGLEMEAGMKTSTPKKGHLQRRGTHEILALVLKLTAG